MKADVRAIRRRALLQRMARRSCPPSRTAPSSTVTARPDAEHRLADHGFARTTLADETTYLARGDTQATLRSAAAPGRSLARGSDG